MLELRKRADKSGPEPARNDAPEDAERRPDGLLVDPSVLPVPSLPEGTLLESWPLAHVELVGEAPAEHNFADSFVSRALADGYLEFVNPRPIASSLPPHVTPYDRDPVITGDQIVLHLDGGDLVYEVLEHPGKFVDDDDPSGYRVSHEYRCQLVSGG